MRAQNALIARRHVIYVGGYDPQGAEGYYRLFERSWKRFLTLWPLASKLGPLVLDSALDYLVSGALVRLLRTSWAFGLVLIYFQMMLIWWLVLSVAGGGLVAYLAAQYLDL